ncbi:putative cytochrome P450 12b2, mitochondrial [Cyphomyrmex costatus]|uniref:Putative cytochrome P450 12b2, mitochondrial n=2 Tax=Cyphomyrmex costatus TaxID=456900 RepID=A0A195CUB6_9HYME|nr:putative cytochrome P450 12b2, mitochondrial [Cyphomyrmex costatus]
MTRARVFIREVNSLRFPLKMQFRTRSIRNYPTESNEIGDTSINLRPTEDIPGPKALPLIGNLFRFMPYIGEYYNVNVLTLMRMLHEKYGNIVKLDGLKKQPTIFLFCPELCKSMYQLQGKIPIRIAMEPLHNYRKNREDIYKGQYGLTTSQGELWKEFRSKVGPHMMRPKIVKMHVAQIHDITNEFVDKISTLLDPKTLELPDDFMNELYKWSVESMCSIALNYRMGCLKSNLAIDSDAQIMINCVKEMFDLTYRIENVPSLLEINNRRNYQKLFNALDKINGISAKYIENAKNNILKTADADRDYSILEKLLCIDEQTALVMALDILMSTDTTSNAAGALLYHIANNKEKQEKLRKEVMSVLPDKTTPITPDVLEKIPYVKGCIKESMRLFPITNGILRNMPKDVSLGGYFIPKGTNVIACHAVLSMDPKYFACPMEYIPERWIRDSPEFSSHKSIHTYVYMPFGYGVRACIGQRFAEMELEILLLKVIRNFRIEWHYGPLEHESQIVNTVKSPLRFKLIDL